MITTSTTEYVSSGLTVSCTESLDGTTATDTSSYDADLAVQTGASDDASGDGSGVLAASGGDSTALGDNTLATADVTGTVSSDPTSSEGYATSTMTAAATSTDDMAYATTTSYADVYGTADMSLSIEFTETTQETSVTETPTTTSSTAEATSTSLSEAYALDISSVPDASLSSGGSTDGASPELDPAATDPLYDTYDLTLDSNVALASWELEAIGDDALTAAELSVLTIEDAYSSVTINTVAAAG